MNTLSNSQTVAMDALQAIAVGEARGSSSLTTFALACMDDVARGVWDVTKHRKELYLARFAWMNAEKAVLGKPLSKVPEGKSLETQVAKFGGFLALGQMSIDLAR